MTFPTCKAFCWSLYISVISFEKIDIFFLSEMYQVVALPLTFLSLQTKNCPFTFIKVCFFFADSNIMYAVVAVLSQSLF